MEDWKDKLVDAVRKAKDIGGDVRAAQRMIELTAWLKDRNLNRVTQINQAAHVVELMELIDRWHDEDVAKQPCAAPAPPVNPFIVERIEREIKRGDHGAITVRTFNHRTVNIDFNPGTYTRGQLRNLAKQLTDLADAHEAVYPPNHCAAAC